LAEAAVTGGFFLFGKPDFADAPTNEPKHLWPVETWTPRKNRPRGKRPAHILAQ
jgi:hypothetical protein